MNPYFLSILTLITVFFSKNCFSEDHANHDLKFSSGIYRQTSQKEVYKSLYIEKLTVRNSAVLRKIQAKKINAVLQELSRSFYIAARRCGDADEIHPWGYAATLDHVTYRGDILSVVFSIEAVCSGRPIFNKFGRNFSLRTGELVSGRNMVRIHAPELLPVGKNSHKDELYFSQEAIDKLRERNNKIPDADVIEICPYSLHRAAFQVWLRDDFLVFFPPYERPKSGCYEEYVVRLK